METWTEVLRGKVRPARGAVPGAGRPGGVGGGGDHVGGGRGAPRNRTRLQPSDTKANIYDRPNTVVMECEEFSVLPPVGELVPFIVEHVLKEPVDKELFTKVESLFADENARKYLLRMKDEPSTEKLAELLSTGVAWPGYRNEEKGRDVVVRGYSMEKPVMDITMTGIGWWTSEAVVKSVVNKWGEVKSLNRVNYTHLGHTISTDKWAIKLVKKKDIIIPPIVVHAGSDRSCEEKEMWKVHYRGVVKVCYRCLKEGHLGRDCSEAPVTMEYLASEPAFEEAPAARTDGDMITGERRTFAQIVKDSSFVETRLARQRAVEERREEIRKKKEKEQEILRKEREMRERGRKGKGKPLGTSEGERERGFSIERLSDWGEDSEPELVSDKKRVAGSPAGAAPDSKAVKTISSKSRGQTPNARESRPGSRPPGLH